MTHSPQLLNRLSEVSNIDFRLYQIKGEDHEEQDDHALLGLLDGVNENMTGIELKYVTMAHLELIGNCYCRPCEKSGLLTIAAGEARISSDFCHLSSTLALGLA